MQLKQMAQGRSDLYQLRPEDITIIGLDTDHKEGEHPLYDERVFNPLREEDILNVMEYGVLVPVTVVRNGDRFEAAAGRQRTRWAREANKRLKESGSKLITVPAILKTSFDEKQQIGVMIAENEIRSEDAIFIKAKKAARMLDYGASISAIATAFGVVPNTVQTWLKIHSLSDDLKEAVKVGKISANAAAAFVELPREQQVKKLDEAIEAKAALKSRDVKDTVAKLKEKELKLDLKGPSFREMKALLKLDIKGKVFLDSKTREALEIVLCAKPMTEEFRRSLEFIRNEKEEE